MSYKYGTNGNDMDWSAIEFLNSFIEEVEVDIFNGVAELDEDGYVTDEYYTGIMDSNPTYIYYRGDINVQEILEKGEKIDAYLDWYIIHDTNDNFITLVGEVPDEYLTEEYIKEREGEMESDIHD